MVTKLEDFRKVIDDYILETGRNKESTEQLQNLIMEKFSTYQPAVKWKLKVMHQAGIISPDPSVGGYWILKGSGKLNFLEKTDSETKGKQPGPVAKKAVLKKEAEDINKLLGDVADDDSEEEIEDDD